MVAVPMMKLFSLTVKTLAKPVAKRLKFGMESKDVDTSAVRKKLPLRYGIPLWT